MLTLCLYFIDAKSVNGNGLFGSLHSLLQVLYRRDCRRSYTPPGHWLAKDLRFGVFMADLDRGKKGPHVNDQFRNIVFHYVPLINMKNLYF